MQTILAALIFGFAITGVAKAADEACIDACRAKVRGAHYHRLRVRPVGRRSARCIRCPAASTRGCEYVERARLATLPRQPLNVDAHAYGAKDEKRQRNCKKDGVPIHVVLLFGATALQKIMRKPGSGDWKPDTSARSPA
jgi:hypothetical protein